MVQNHFGGMKRVSVTMKLIKLWLPFLQQVGNFGDGFSGKQESSSKDIGKYKHLGKQGIVFRGHNDKLLF